MLSENIKNARLKTGLSQQELAGKLNVVRQTVSKWEKGTSVPDAAMLKSTADILNVSVNALLDIADTDEDSEQIIKDLTARIELMKKEAHIRGEHTRKLRRALFIVLASLCAIVLFIFLTTVISEHIITNTSSSIGIIGGADGPTSIIVTSRISPRLLIPVFAAVLFAASVVGIVLTRKKK